MKMDANIEDQLRAWAEDAASKAPPWVPERLHLRASVQRRPGRRLAGAAMALAVVGGAVWIASSRPGRPTVIVELSEEEKPTVVGGMLEPEAEPEKDQPAGDSLLSCGTEPHFLASALAGPSLQFDLGDPAVASALEHQTDVEQLRGHVLVRSDDLVMVAVDTEEVGGGFASFEIWYSARSDSGWKLQGGGSCRLRRVVDGLRTDPWEIDTSGPRPGPTATEIPILVHEQNCAGGRTAEGRVREPIVSYGERAVTVAITVEPAWGDCASNPPTPVVLKLREPLGDRLLLDGGSEPPSPPQRN